MRLPLLGTTNESNVFDKRPLSVCAANGGDRVYLYSDGIPEARDAEGEQWGNERLSECLSGLRETDLDEGLPVVLETVRAWQGGEHFDDDVSLLAVEIP